MQYRIFIEKGEDSGFIAHCPAIPGCHSQGKTIEDAIESITDAIKGCLEVIDKELQ
jgi:predicted RNase H-like HicB family nuclease